MNNSALLRPEIVSDFFTVDGDAMLEAARANGLEGIVAKTRGSKYEGRRSRHGRDGKQHCRKHQGFLPPIPITDDAGCGCSQQRANQEAAWQAVVKVSGADLPRPASLSAVS